MAAPVKFTFDLDMGKGAERKRAFSDNSIADMVARAREEGFAEGFAAGEHSQTAQAARALSVAADTIADTGVQMLAAVDDAKGEMLREAVELAASVGRKLAGHLLARQPQAEIEALLTDCLSSLDGVPHLVIRCHPDIADGVREIATARMATSHFNGRLIVMGEPEQRLGDCRIEWVDGGLVRDVNAINIDINQRIATFIASRRKG